MPTYDFECEECKNVFEEVCAYEDVGDMLCLECNSKTKKLMSVPGIAFKGSGFYCTDNKAQPVKQKETPKQTPSDKKSSVNKGKIKRD